MSQSLGCPNEDDSSESEKSSGGGSVARVANSSQATSLSTNPELPCTTNTATASTCTCTKTKNHEEEYGERSHKEIL